MSNERRYPPQGYPQGYLPHKHPLQGNPRGYPPQGYPQGYPPQNHPPQGNLQGYPPMTYPRLGYPPQWDAFPQPQGYRPPEYPNDAYVYPPQGYNYPYAQPPQPQFMNHRSQNTYNQIGGGQNNPQIQGVDVIHSGGDFIMGSSSGATNNFNNQGSYADKQIQGVNGGSNQM